MEGFNYAGIAYDDPRFAERTQSALLRSQWNESRPQMESLISRLRRMYTDPNGTRDAANSAMSSAGIAFDQSMNQAERELVRAPLTPQQRESFERVSKLQRGISQVGAANMAARSNEDLRREIATQI